MKLKPQSEETMHVVKVANTPKPSSNESFFNYEQAAKWLKGQTSKLCTVPLSRLRRLPYNPPGREDVDIDALAASMRDVGQSTPIDVADGADSQLYVGDGNRRVSAAKRLQWPTLRARVWTGGSKTLNALYVLRQREAVRPTLLQRFRAAVLGGPPKTPSHETLRNLCYAMYGEERAVALARAGDGRIAPTLVALARRVALGKYGIAGATPDLVRKAADWMVKRHTQRDVIVYLATSEKRDPEKTYRRLWDDIDNDRPNIKYFSRARYGPHAPRES